MKLKKLVLTAILSSLAIVLYEFVAIPIPPTDSPLFVLSLGIIPIFFIAYYCGTLYAAISAGVVDVLGWLLFSSTKYAFNIGFTIASIVGALIIGLILKFTKELESKKGLTLIIIVMSAFTLVIIPLFLFTYYKDGIGAISYAPEIAGWLAAIIALVLNVIVVEYTFIGYKKKKSTNALNLAFIAYQYIVSFFLNPLAQSLMSKINIANYWLPKLITVPIVFIIYSLVSRLILKVLDKKYKKIED